MQALLWSFWMLTVLVTIQTKQTSGYSNSGLKAIKNSAFVNEMDTSIQK
jgi:hypothetical protein